MAKKSPSGKKVKPIAESPTLKRRERQWQRVLESSGKEILQRELSEWSSMLALAGVRKKRILLMRVSDGRIARVLAGKGAQVFGLETNDELLREAQKLEDQEQLGITYSRNPPFDLPVAENSLDLIFASDILHRYPRSLLEASIKEIGRMLRPGGALIVSLPHPFLFKRSPEGSERRSEIFYTRVRSKLSRLSEQYLEQKGGVEGSSTVWNHPLSLYLDIFATNKLTIAGTREVRTPVLTSEEVGHQLELLQLVGEKR